MTRTAGDRPGRAAGAAEPAAPRPRLLDDDAVAAVQQSIEERLLGGPRRWTRAEMAERTGIELDRARRLWVAMGFAESEDPGARLYTDDDVDALRRLTALVDEGVVKPEMEVSIVRALGQTLSRLAEWEVDLVRGYVLEQAAALADDGAPLDPAAAGEEIGSVVDRLLPAIDSLQNYAWRRHLVANSARATAGAGQDVGRRTLVVGFADIVGYTRLTRELSARELTELLEHFETATMGVIAERRGWVVKTVGDEVMFAVADPVDAAEIALELSERTTADPLLPGVRVGMALGEVLVRFGDAYGSVVNIAARLTSVAKPDTILLDRELADALADHEGVALKSLRPVRVRGLHRLAPHALRRADPDRKHH